MYCNEECPRSQSECDYTVTELVCFLIKLSVLPYNDLYNICITIQ